MSTASVRCPPIPRGVFWLIALSCALGLACQSTEQRLGHDEKRVVYGDDNRCDIYAYTNLDLASRARDFTVALMVPAMLDVSDPENVQFAAKTLGERYSLCEEERFAEQLTAAACSGTLIAPDLVLTASHVVERDEDIPVVLPNRSQVKATLVGRDPGSDLAVIRTESALPAVAEPAGGGARVGQLVLALGRPTEEGIQASLGVVSAVSGPVHTRRGGVLEGHIRTDAIPYPGFSGGPLIDASGQVLGMNTSGLTRGASIAIPVKLGLKVAEALVKHGSVRRGYLGVRSQPVEIPVQSGSDHPGHPFSRSRPVQHDESRQSLYRLRTVAATLSHENISTALLRQAAPVSR